MGKKPALTVVPDRSVTGSEPPISLAEPGRTLWNRVMAEYHLTDIGGLATLEQACAALDRAEALRAEIERDGAVIRTRGAIKDHPALKHELANRAFVVRTLGRLGLNFEPVKATIGRPPEGIGWKPHQW